MHNRSAQFQVTHFISVLKGKTIIVAKKRLLSLWDLMRLLSKILVRKCLKYFTTPLKRPPGRPKTTWISIDLNELKLYLGFDTDSSGVLERREILCPDRKTSYRSSWKLFKASYRSNRWVCTGDDGTNLFPSWFLYIPARLSKYLFEKKRHGRFLQLFRQSLGSLDCFSKDSVMIYSSIQEFYDQLFWFFEEQNYENDSLKFL